MENNKINAATRALARGWKMTAKHCDKCGLPLFKVDDRNVCVFCDMENDASLRKKESKKESEKSNESRVVEDNVSTIVQNKLKELALRLEKEQETGRIREILEAMNAAIRLLKEM